MSDKKLEVNYDLEEIHDSQIVPLMSQIIAICKTYRLPMFATFQYKAQDVGEDGEEFGHCTTNLPFPGERQTNNNMRSLEPAMRSTTGMIALAVTRPK